MKLNADFGARASAHMHETEWSASPIPGVERKMLDRIGGEVARATSLVRYAPGSNFSPHTHDGGEEFLVLDGEFQDEHGDFPVGSYVRNPPGSHHQPGSAPGCTIFVKLRQFDPGDRLPVTLDTTVLALSAQAGRGGAETAVIHEDARECVRIERWAPGARIEYTPSGGLEILCLEGGFEESGEAFALWSWLRLPAGARLSATVGSLGCRLWLKEGHLRDVPAAS